MQPTSNRYHGAFAGAALLAGVIAPAFAGDPEVCPRGCRYATIQDAIDHAQAGAVIDISPGIYKENVVVSDKPITLRGRKAALTIVSGVAMTAVVTTTCADSGTLVQLADLTITGGHPEGLSSFQGHGSGIFNAGCALSLDRMAVTDNAGKNPGGAIESDGPLWIRDSVVSGNTGLSAGMHLSGHVRIVRTLIENNASTGEVGAIGAGGMYLAGNVTIVDSDIVDNRQSNFESAGGIENHGTLRLIGSRVSGNLGGGLGNHGSADIVDSTISSHGSTHNQIGGVYNTGQLTINRSQIMNNLGAWAGGIRNRGTLVIRNSTIFRNQGRDGGGLLNLAGTAELSSVSIVDNSGVAGFAEAGGITNANGATVNLRHVTITGNTPTDCIGPGFTCP